MLKKLVDFPDVITLVPNSGIQMLDFGINASQSSLSSLTRSFWPEHAQEIEEDGRRKIVLHPVEERETGPFYRDEQYPNGRAAPPDDINVYGPRNALAVFNGEWLPAPVLRVRHGASNGRMSYDVGPMGWARVRVAALETPDEAGNTHRVTLAVDTTLGPARRRAGPEDGSGRDAQPYLAPEPRDATDPIEFQYVSSPYEIMFFLEAKAIRRWIKDRFLACLSRVRKRAMTEDDIDPGEYWAQYIVLLEAISAGCKVPRLKLIDTLSDPKSLQPVGVDLVIDVGNSRTCGILIEKGRGDKLSEISHAIRLELRDLTRTERAYVEPFATWLEFSPARFGSYAHARRTSQQNAFWWPSLIRVGPEAAWLASLSDGTEGVTGLSSPKRYLWDTSARIQAWANTRGLTPAGEDPPEIKGPMTAELTEEGELVGKGDAMVGTSIRYSRSSLYTLMLVELLSHALMQINSPALRYQRADRDVPRRLDTLILTLPSATPLAERKLLQRRAREAWELLARIMRWEEGDPLHSVPKLRLEWDEATCTHLVYLYNEINFKYKGMPGEFFRRRGQGRTGERGKPALRIASIDIGGGTTDLMIIEHEVEGQSMVHPHQLFREGFRLAGDDIVKTVVETVVLPAVGAALKARGVSLPESLLSDLFGGDREGMAQQERTLRVNFSTQVLVPLALALLAAYEATEGRRVAADVDIPVAALLEERPPQPPVRAYLETAARRRGGEDFHLEDVTLVMRPAQMAGIVGSVIGGMLDDLCDIVRHYQCDLLLLSGRPSRLPLVQERIHGNLPLAPSRVIAMHRYEVLNWYPFRSSDFRITDPKTTAVVGALLCLLCEGRSPGFYMKSSEIRMKSTARYIGVMDQRGEINKENERLKNINLDNQGGGNNEFIVEMERPTFLGFRQLPLVRWRTSPLYFLSFKNPDRLSGALTLPISVRLQGETVEEGADQTKMEDFKVVEAVDANGRNCKHEISFRLQTLWLEGASEGGYWLDTGVFQTLRH
ncbi:virulence factor SrfB [Pararhodospirillum oryzae]|uniref:Virulence factor SrfB n=1 Tax=Pararhodospirillum oryzae TaxID=478448 RepID=A0A512H8D2_9PROT|nr:virulence factor SrfB [Pararhodospirillum oryzae]GEO81719.1 virulence factor SrfB [Pararhodospirillum oryzae]